MIILINGLVKSARFRSLACDNGAKKVADFVELTSHDVVIVD